MRVEVRIRFQLPEEGAELLKFIEPRIMLRS